MVKLTKSSFDAGSPYSMWLKEEIIGEIANYKSGQWEHRGLIEKYNINIFDGIDDMILHEVKKIDDYPEPLKNMAVEIIRIELDPTFKL